MPRFMLVYLLAAFALITPYSTTFAAEDEAWLILQKASQAARELSYQGVFMYQSEGNAKSVQITHMNYGQGEYARMVVLDGTPREVLSQGNDVVIFSPKNEKVVIEKRRGQNMFPALLPANMTAIKLSYQARLGEIERIGGREGQVVYLEPRDNLRYGYKFWADKQYGLLLKAMTANERKEPMEQMAFSQLTLMSGQNMDWFQPNVDLHKTYVMEETNASITPADTVHWTVSKIPPGYRKTDEVQRTVPGKSSPLTHILFSDGLASVSLFIEMLPKNAQPKKGHTTMGATNLYASNIDGYQIVVVGEVPEATVAQFATAVTFKK